VHAWAEKEWGKNILLTKFYQKKKTSFFISASSSSTSTPISSDVTSCHVIAAKT
jgi:hypothetical protein